MTAKRDRRVFLLALLLAATSAILAYALLASRPQTAPVVVEAPAPSGDPVLIAARSIEEGETLAASDIEIVYVAPEAKGNRVLTESAQAIGKVALVEIPRGDQLLASSVGDAVAVAPETFAREVPVGMRAVSIAMEETVGAGGLIQPGDRVDVIASYELKPPKGGSSSLEGVLGGLIDFGDLDSGDEGESDESDDEPDPFPVAELLVQDVEVLAIGQALNPAVDPAPPPASADESAPTSTEETGPAPRPEAASVTLLVDPAEALRLLLAVEADGIFRLLLRAPGDASTTELPPALITDGAMPMEPFKLMGANLSPEDLVVTSARFRQSSIPAGGTLEFEATVRNVSSRLIPAGRGGAGPGHVYHAGESWQSLDDMAPTGVYSLGVTSESVEPRTYPWRWDLGQDLAPGETVTISGGIQAPNAPGIQRWWFGTILQPGTVQDDGVAAVEITIEPASSVVVMASGIDLQEAPWPSAESVLQVAQGTRVDVLDYQDGWFRVHSGDREGWLPESAVTNAALIEATAAATPVASS